MAGFPDRMGWSLMSIALLCPITALSVRRLHDSGRSGWWLLLALPGVADGLRRQFLLWQSPFDFARSQLPGYLELPAALLALTVLAMLFMDDQEGANAYGPNPRHPNDVSSSDPAGEPA